MATVYSDVEWALVENAVRIFALPEDKMTFRFDHSFADPTQEGSCVFTSSDEQIEVLLKKGLPLWKQLYVLAHECIHVQQVVDGRLEMGKAAGYFYFENDEINSHNIAYRELPWEVEAWNNTALYMRHFLAECPRWLYDAVEESSNAV